MQISPSIASANLLRIEEEVKFIDEYFDSIHLDIEDGNAVRSISFGFKLAKQICDLSKAKEKTIHLEVLKPLNFMSDVKKCNADVVFIQADALDNPIKVIDLYRENGICVGVNLSNLDMARDCLGELVESCSNILINTTHHDDLEQICDNNMLEYAIDLAKKGKKVWIDGGINWDIYNSIIDSPIHSAVMGRAIFKDKGKIAQYISK